MKKFNDLKAKLEEKLETLLVFKKDFEEEIIIIKEQNLIKQNELKNRIVEFNKVNKDLEQVCIKAKTIYQYKDDILQKRIKIAEKYRLIKDIIITIDEKNNQKTTLINTYIKKIHDVSYF